MFVFLVAAAVVAGIAAVYDARTGHIPNWITLGALAAAPIAHAAHGAALDGAAGALREASLAVLGAVACAIVPALMFRVGAMGGGDVKLFAAIGALAGAFHGLETETYGFVAAALIAPAKLAYEGKLLRTLANACALVVNPFRPAAQRRAIPEELMTWFRLAPAIFLGALVTVIGGGVRP